jgi:glycosyltransferase involved in cell wall biosynthesis
MEMDDYFKGVPGYSGAFETNNPGGQQDYWGTRQMEVSTGIVCATDYLSDSARKYNGSVRTVPNCIDFELWDKCPRKEHELVRIGWIGGSSHDGDLKIIKDALYEILDKYKNVEVYIVSCPPPSWTPHDRLIMVNKYAMIMEYPAHVKGLSFDIGLAPLRDNSFNRSKSNLRYLEMSACGIPTVASDVEPFRHNFKGIIAENHGDWVKHLSNLIEDEKMRKGLGKTAYDNVKKHFCVERGSEIYTDYIKQVLNGVDSGNRA